MSKFIAIAVIIFSIGMINLAFAESCTADSTLSKVKAVQNNKFLFIFDVSASTCSTSCSGFVQFAIKYHYRDSPLRSILTDIASVSYQTPIGSSRVHVSTEYSVGNINSSIEIDDVNVEKTTCLT